MTRIHKTTVGHTISELNNMKRRRRALEAGLNSQDPERRQRAETAIREIDLQRLLLTDRLPSRKAR